VERQVVALSIVVFFVMTGLSIIAPILPGYAESFGVNLLLIGLTVSAFPLARLFLDAPTGILAERYNRKWLMTGGLVLIAAASVLAGFAWNYGVLLMGRLLEGAGSAFYVTTSTTWLAERSHGPRRGSLMAIYSAGILLGAVIGPAIGGFAAAAVSLNFPFFLYALMALAGIAIVSTLPSGAVPAEAIRPAGERFRWTQLREILRSPGFAAVSLATFAVFFIRSGLRADVIPLYASRNLGLDAAGIGLAITAAGLGSFATMIPSGRISDRVGRRRPLLACLVLTGLAVLLLPSTADFAALSAVMVFYGAAAGLQGPLMAYVADVAPAGRMGSAIGVNRTISDLGFVAGPLILGGLAGLGGGPEIGWAPFVAAAALLFVVAAIVVPAPDPARRLVPPRPILDESAP